jgi:hypothetical protein
MIWIVCPPFTVEAAVPVEAVVPVTVKSMAVEEAVVNEHYTAEPVRAPAPAVPAAPEAEVNTRSPSKSICRVVQRRVGAPRRRTPDIGRVISRHIDYIGVGRLNGDSRLATLDFRAHRLLRCRGQASIGLCRRAQLLDRRHHVGLLCQKRIAHVRCPAYVLVQALQHIGKRDQRLHAGIPRLLFRSLCQLGST